MQRAVCFVYIISFIMLSSLYAPSFGPGIGCEMDPSNFNGEIIHSTYAFFEVSEFVVLHNTSLGKETAIRLFGEGSSNVIREDTFYINGQIIAIRGMNHTVYFGRDRRGLEIVETFDKPSILGKMIKNIEFDL